MYYSEKHKRRKKSYFMKQVGKALDERDRWQVDMNVEVLENDVNSESSL